MTIPLGTLLKAGSLLALLGLEKLAPYRTPTQPRLRRWAVNIPLAVANSLIIQFLFTGAFTLVFSRNLGILEGFGLSSLWRLVAGLLFIDLALYVWHRANHEVGLLWRVHRVHHSDLDLDVTTAGRFHVVELALWAVIKFGLLFLVGLTVAEILFIETTIVLVSQFQHSAVKLPAGFEKALGLLSFGPTHHRMHHSTIMGEGNTNYGTIFSFWDRLFRSHHAYRDSTRIVIGISGQPAHLGLPALLTLPFSRSGN